MAYSSSNVVHLAILTLMAVFFVVEQCTAQNSPEDYVALHNAARAVVGVGPVTWDDTVAAWAQSYAAQRQGDCALQHSPQGRPYGENTFAGPAGHDWSAKDAVDSWVSEQKYYDHDTNFCSAPVGESCLHYTQVVWRSSTTIGCARVDCSNGGAFIICSYKPPGNWGNQSPY